MSNNTIERDILADILDDSNTGTLRGLDELSKLIHVTSPVENPLAEFAKLRSESAAPKKNNKKRSKRKTTLYLNEDVFDDLDEAKRAVKEFLPTGSRTIVTKSRIAESAIKVLLSEFEQKGKKSYLVMELLKLKRKN